MATIINRKRFSVSVPRRPALERTYTYNTKDKDKVEAYVCALKADGQLTDKLLSE